MTPATTPTRKSSLGRNLIALGLFIGAVVPAVIKVPINGDGSANLLSYLVIPGMLLYCFGLASVARGKGHSGWWGLTGLACWIGGISVAFLKRKENSVQPPPQT
jgi:hypothetical protein